MRRTRKITIRTRTYESLNIRESLPPAFVSECAVCARRVRWSTFADASVHSGFTTAEMIGYSAAGKLHFQTSTDGHLYVCSEALESAIKSERRTQ